MLSHCQKFAKVTNCTLVFIRDKERVLLGYKKRGFGLGKWNGFGGKIEPGESAEEGAKRELLEECGLVVKSLEKIGLLQFEFVDQNWLLNVQVFTSQHFHGLPVETAEMRPEWYSVNDIPFNQMWVDDAYWFPYFLNGKKFQGIFQFEGYETILSHQIKELDDVPDIV